MRITRFNLGTVRTLTKAEIYGDSLMIRRSSHPHAEITVHRDADQGNPITLRVGEGWRNVPFEQLQISWAAQTGAWVDLVSFSGELPGAMIVPPWAGDPHPDTFVSGIGSATGTGDTAVIAAPGAGLRLFIESVTVTNADAAVDTNVILKSASTERHRLPAPLSSGSVWTPRRPLICAANEAFNFASAGAATTMYVSATGHIDV